MKFLLTILALTYSTMSFAQSLNTDSVFHQEDEFKIYQKDEVDTQAEHPKGNKAILQWIAKNLHYPVDAKNNNIQGTVFGSFIVEMDGSISNIKVKQGVNESCDNEVIRLFKQFDTWKPAIKDGKKVRSEVIIPVGFKLAGTSF